MKTFEAIQQRRAIKHYANNAPMSDEEFQQLMEAVILSPTSYNIQNWRFVRVTDQALRAELKEAGWGQEQISTASELIILCANVDAWKEQPERYWANADETTRNILVPMIKDFYHDYPQKQRDEAMRSCGIASQTLMLAAKSMGYETSPMIGFDVDKVAELINLPENHLVVMMIAVGKSDTQPYPRGGQLPLSEVLVENGF
ncbi:nitroreductase family protein [Litoribacillus peritrichatus]|uniref:Nitroreductase family protein n=1 Tax=Litoribacillus peritrichatus TaxID=718191 RepID=A0ABP7N0N6_9GAMM